MVEVAKIKMLRNVIYEAAGSLLTVVLLVNWNRSWTNLARHSEKCQKSVVQSSVENGEIKRLFAFHSSQPG